MQEPAAMSETNLTCPDQEDDEREYMQNYLYSIMDRINPPFFERKMQRGVAETIEEEIEELYSEICELDAYIKSLISTNAVLLNNYEERTREFTENKLQLSQKYQSMKEQLQQQKKDLTEMESMKMKVSTRNEALSEQIKKMEQIYNKTSKQYDNLSEEILTLSDYEDKLYQLKEEWSLNQDLINNLKYEHNEYQMMMGIVKQKMDKKERSKSVLKNKLNTIEEKLKNLNDKEKSELAVIEHMSHHLEFLQKTFINLKEVNARKEEERKLLNLMIEQNEQIKMREKKNTEYIHVKNEESSSLKKSENKAELNFDNLENEFKEMNLKDDVFSNISANQFALLSHRNTRIGFMGMSGNLTFATPRTEKKEEKPREEEQIEEIALKNNSRMKKKKKKDNPDQVYIETLNFFIKHRYTILFVCFLVPVFRYSYG